MAALAGGAGALQKALDTAIEGGEYQWALQLTDWLLRLQPENSAVLEARIEALTRLGEVAGNPNARHYYLMSALELRDGTRFAPIAQGTPEMLRAIPMRSVMDAMAASLRAEQALDRNEKVVLRFTDLQQSWTLWLRRGVLEAVPEELEGAAIVVSLDSLIWKQMLGRILNPAVAMAQHMDFVEGGAIGLGRFMLLFQPVRAAPEPAPFATVGL